MMRPARYSYRDALPPHRRDAAPIPPSPIAPVGAVIITSSGPLEVTSTGTIARRSKAPTFAYPRVAPGWMLAMARCLTGFAA